MRSLRSRFIISHLLPILIVLPLFGIGLIFILETQIQLADLSADVNGRASLIAAALESQPDIWQNADQAAAIINALGQSTNGQIFLLETNGALFATNDPALINQIGQPFPNELEGLTKALEGESSVFVYYNFSSQRGQALVPVRDINEQLVGIVGVTETLNNVLGDFSQLRNLILLTLLIELLVAIAIALFLARRLSQPIRNVSQAVTEIASGERVEEIQLEGPKEIRQLASSVNILTERLRSLEDARRRLLANMVHELGRPLGAMRSAVHILRQGAGDDPVIRDELLGGIENEIIRMQPLLEDLAQLHGQVLGTLTLNREPIAISKWLPSILLPWRTAALDKKLDWHMEIPADLPVISVDTHRLGQAIGNLLSNAIKYTPAGGQVTVGAKADSRQVTIDIIDTGPGISQEEQEKVFLPFFRSTQQRRFPQGLGLGLTIAQEMVEAHGGELMLSSQTGQGSCFSIILPRLNGDVGTIPSIADGS